MESRDKNGLSLRYGDTVIVQTSPDATACTAKVLRVNPTGALDGCTLVEFENGTRQWMDAKHLTMAGGDA